MSSNSQEQAIKKTKGPCIILAGAGTGKTYTVVEKINYMINEEKSYNAEEILCLTFSNEATADLKRKIQKRTKNINVTVKTFHSFCSDILRDDGHLIGVDQGFEIILPDDAKILIHRELKTTPYHSGRYISSIHTAKDLGVKFEDIKAYKDSILQQIKEIISSKDMEEEYKRLSLTLQTLHLEPQETKEQENREKKSVCTDFLELYDDYQKYNEFVTAWENYDKLKKEKKLMDFSDLNHHVLALFETYTAKKYFEQYKYIFIDEFQDTNLLQFKLIEHIADHKNITVVGDPNQSIYGFRGSYKDSFEHFKRTFEVNDKTDLFTLDKSRRSPNTILNVSYDLIKNNYEDLSECIHVSKNFEDTQGEKVKITEVKNKYEEARYIADLVDEKIKQGIPKSEICVMIRTHKQSEVIHQALNLKGIPVISAGKINLLQRREIITAIAYLSILSNLQQRSGFGEQSWWNLFHYQNTLSPSDSVKIGRFLKDKRKQDISIDDVMLNTLDETNISEQGKIIVKRIIDKLQEISKVSNKALPELVLDVYQLCGLNREFTHERSIDNVESLFNLKKFHELAVDYYEKYGKDLPGFIDYLEMIDNLGVNVDATKTMHLDAVRLMTIHATKGLEYKVVIVSNLADDRFPVTRTRNEPLIPKHLLLELQKEMAKWGEISETEKGKRIKKYEKDMLLFEERRLCYVAFTRAKEQLILTFADSYKENDENGPSTFLQEIDYLKNENCNWTKDEGELATVIAPNSEYEQYKSLLKQQLVNSLDVDSFDAIISRLMNYVVCRDKQVCDFSNSVKCQVDAEELNRHLAKCTEGKSLLIFDKESFTFSPTAMQVYDECPKKYELAQIYHMPQRGEFSDDDVSGADVGSFVHKVLEDGVNSKFTEKKQYIDYAIELLKLPEYTGITLEDVENLISVFYERNKNKINDKSKTEKFLACEIDGFKFNGIADRIDTLDDGTVEIIDYKTNKNSIDPKKRSWQLGFYALALQNSGLKVSKLTLEMLRLDKPVEMTMDEQGNASSGGRSEGFNLNVVKEQLTTCCKSIAHDFETSFKLAKDDNKCMFCGYKFYCPKWDEN